MKNLLLASFFIYVYMNGMQNNQNIINCITLQKLMNEFMEQPIEYRSPKIHRNFSEGKEWRRAKNGIIGKYSKNNTLEIFSIPEEGQTVELTFENSRGKYIVFPDKTKWKFWLDEDLECWFFMKDDFELLPKARYTKIK